MSSHGRADLHTHSNASDGALTPAELVEEAQWKGLSCIALTDHDTMRGVDAAIAAGATAGIEVLGGVELSCEYGDREVHVLGYRLDRPAEVEAACQEVRAHRKHRMREMVEKAAGLGLDVTYEEVAALSEGGSVGRPHLARLLVEKRYVGSMTEAFARYLGDDGAAYVPKKRLTVRQGIDLIHAAGGLAVIAHPGIAGVEDVLEDLLKLGSDGIEVRYSMHSPTQEQRFSQMAASRKLLTTGGSDYHGDPSHGRELGVPSVPCEWVRKLKAVKTV
jgi:hypothetical protein